MERLKPGLTVRGKWIYIRKTIRGERHDYSLRIEAKSELYQYANQRLAEIETDAYKERPQEVPTWKIADGYLGLCPPTLYRRDKLALDTMMHFQLEDGRKMGDVLGHELNKPMLRQYLDHEKDRGRLNGGIARDFAAMKRALRAGLDDLCHSNGKPFLETIPAFPRVSMKATKVGHIFSQEEQKLFIPLLPKNLQPMWLFGIHAGCRPGEIENLEWSWFREKDGIPYFSLPASATKMGRNRPVVLNQSALRIVENQPKGEYVFACRNMYTRQLRGAWRKAGLPMDPLISRGPHNCRKTFASRLRDCGVPEWTVKDALGHKGDVTRIYALPTLQAIHEAVQAPYLVKDWGNGKRLFVTH